MSVWVHNKTSSLSRKISYLLFSGRYDGVAHFTTKGDGAFILSFGCRGDADGLFGLFGSDDEFLALLILPIRIKIQLK